MTLSCSACTSLQQNVSLVQDAALKVAFCPQQQLPRHGFGNGFDVFVKSNELGPFWQAGQNQT